MNKLVFTFLSLLLATTSSLQALEVGEPMEDKGNIQALDSGLRLQLFIEDHKVHAYFIDEDGKIAESPADSIAMEAYQAGNKNNAWRSVLVAGSDAGMAAPRLIYPPYALKTRIIVRYKDGTTESIFRFMGDLERNVTEAPEEN